MAIYPEEDPLLTTGKMGALGAFADTGSLGTGQAAAAESLGSMTAGTSDMFMRGGPVSIAPPPIGGPRGDPNRGGGGSGGGGTSGWDSVYAANVSQQQPYMNQYGTEADQRLASIQQGAMNASVATGNQAGQWGTQAGAAAAGIGGLYGEAASQFGQGAAQSLVNAGGTAAQIGAAGQQQALTQAMNLGHTANMAIGAGQQAVAQGQAAAGQVGNFATGAAQTGAQGSLDAQRAAQQVGATGRLGLAAANTGMQGLGTAQSNLQQAGQQATAMGREGQQFGQSVAQQGQGFLGERGYQAQLGDANQARQAAQGAAQQLGGVEAQEGPSAAQAQLRQGLNQAQSANLAMARSGRGFGGSASALGQAQVANAQAGQQAANQSAQLRAQENAAFRQRQAANLQAAGGLQLQAGQQAMSREQMLAQQQLGQTQANREAFLASQGLGMQGQQLGLQGVGQNVAAQQAAAQAAAQSGQLGIAGAQQAMQAQQAAGQLGLQGSQLGLQGQQIGGQLATQGGQLGLQGAQVGMQGLGLGMEGFNQQTQAGLAGSQLALAGQNANIGAINQAGSQGLAGILGGGQLNLAGTTQGGQLGLQGLQQQQQGIGQAGALGLAAEGQRAANQQYGFNLAEAETARDLQIAGMQAGFNLNNAAMANQGAGGAIGAGAALLPLLALSDVNAKTDIVPLGANGGAMPMTPAGQSDLAGSIGRDQAMQARAANMMGMTPRAGEDPYGIEYGAKRQEEREAADKKKRFGKLRPIADAGAAFGQSMQSGLNPSINPVTGQPWMMMSDERAKYGYAVSDERAKRSAGEMVDELDPYAFRYKDPERHGAGQHFGIMAQDLERSPAGRTVVEEGPDGMKRVNTPKLTMLNAAALAQYDDRLSEIEARVKRMGGKAA